jgi:hypothetical protein
MSQSYAKAIQRQSCITVEMNDLEISALVAKGYLPEEIFTQVFAACHWSPSVLKQ